LYIVFSCLLDSVIIQVLHFILLTDPILIVTWNCQLIDVFPWNIWLPIWQDIGWIQLENILDYVLFLYMCVCVYVCVLKIQNFNRMKRPFQLLEVPCKEILKWNFTYNEVLMISFCKFLIIKCNEIVFLLPGNLYRASLIDPDMLWDTEICLVPYCLIIVKINRRQYYDNHMNICKWISKMWRFCLLLHT
jgi:hypothetical protein